MSRGHGGSRQRHRQAPSQTTSTLPADFEQRLSLVQREYKRAARSYTVLGRIWNRITGWFRRGTPYKIEGMRRPRRVVREGRRRPSGIEPCGGQGCRGTPQNGIHCGRHRQQHLARLRRRAHRKRVRAQKQRTRR